MSNKLIKRSHGYLESKEWIKKRLDETGGINVSVDLVQDMNDAGLSLEDFDQLLDILAELSDDGYPIYKISRVCKGEETKGMMICSPETVVAFAKNPEELEKKD